MVEDGFDLVQRRVESGKQRCGSAAEIMRRAGDAGFLCNLACQVLGSCWQLAAIFSDGRTLEQGFQLRCQGQDVWLAILGLRDMQGAGLPVD